MRLRGHELHHDHIFHTNCAPLDVYGSGHIPLLMGLLRSYVTLPKGYYISGIIQSQALGWVVLSIHS